MKLLMHMFVSVPEDHDLADPANPVGAAVEQAKAEIGDKLSTDRPLKIELGGDPDAPVPLRILAMGAALNALEQSIVDHAAEIGVTDPFEITKMCGNHYVIKGKGEPLNLAEHRNPFNRD